jgi:hypothetical protein
MSNHYDVYCDEPGCLNVGDRLGVDINHGVAVCEVIVRERAAFEALGRAEEAISLLKTPDYFSFDMSVRINCNAIDSRFFARHVGHRLRVRSEYGYASDECGRFPPQSALCETGWCSLPRGHASANEYDSPPEAHEFDGRVPEPKRRP